MRIKFVEIQNFRKLESIRIDFSDRTTLFVGANNSGKTSAMVALGYFLVDPGRFTTNDFTLSKWADINKIGDNWQKKASQKKSQLTTLSAWEEVLPSLDLWLNIEMNELHYVRHLLPTLDWAGGLLGVRLRFEPKTIKDHHTIGDLHKDYLTAFNAAKETKSKAGVKKSTFALWPNDIRDFLDRRLNTYFTMKGYLLDPTKCETPNNGIANPQALPSGSEPIESDPLKGLIQVNEIWAQRELGDSRSNKGDADGRDGYSARGKHKLSEQLRSYYSKHLDPSEYPEPADLDALEAIEKAQELFDERLASGFFNALKELESLNYPGVTNPKLKIVTKIRPTDGLNHSAAVQYEVLSKDGTSVTVPLRLPEQYNGLGYQNLIYMVFKLMSYRDAWMRVGKAGKAAPSSAKENYLHPPLHLVLIEEPEAYLHAQVQQVFVRKAYDVLRNHDDLREKPALQTQLIVSTHSSHVAHELKFSNLRYFRRLPAMDDGNVPTSVVINLSEVFGPKDETNQFVTRYLRATHCDLFFADAAILVEGSAERMLIPHFIREHFKELNRCYVTLLEIGGSHAHRLRPLIEQLGLTTLIITDLDSVESSGHHKATTPKRSCDQLSGNATLKEWHPKLNSIDDLLDLSDEEKVKDDYDIPRFSIRVAYQIPIMVTFDDKKEPAEVPATTFEDSLVYENLSLFKELDGDGMVKKFKAAIDDNPEPKALSAKMFEILKNSGKAAFALDLLDLKDPKELKVPKYISEGLTWLQNQFVEVAAPVVPSGEK